MLHLTILLGFLLPWTWGISSRLLPQSIAAVPYLGHGVAPLGHASVLSKAKWLSEEALQIAVKRREVESKAEKERYTHLNAEFQRIARRERKAFLSNQCKEIEENNRMGKTRDLFKKIRDKKETFHAKMGSIKDRNGMELTNAEDIKKRWQEYTEELYKKIFMTQILTMV